MHLPPIEHLMVMKAVAGRARDLEDIRQLARANPTLDLNQVLRWITQFADLLGAPHLLEQARSILRPAKKRKRRPRK